MIMQKGGLAFQIYFEKDVVLFNSVTQDYIWMTSPVAMTSKSQQSVKPRRKAIGGKLLKAGFMVTVRVKKEKGNTCIVSFIDV